MAPPPGPDAGTPEVRKAEREAGNAVCILISSNAESEELAGGRHFNESATSQPKWAP
jgi:hypothetical protein